ncbi:MAG: hypothetical protein HKN01_07915 [Acidimicrobiia bacterium]|nr:hypothetical protein [Acidimicrobiia bacterium]
MTQPTASVSRSLATIGLAVSGPIAFFTGLFAAAMVPGGVPRPLLIVFLAAALASLLCGAAYVLAWQREAADS